MTTFLRKMKKSIAKSKEITLVFSKNEKQGKPEEKKRKRKQIKERRRVGRKSR